MSHRLSLSQQVQGWFDDPANTGVATQVVDWLEVLADDPSAVDSFPVPNEYGVPTQGAFVDYDRSRGSIRVSYTVVADPPAIRVHKIVSSSDVPMM